jgi:ankyrin repeat protein
VSVLEVFHFKTAKQMIRTPFQASQQHNLFCLLNSADNHCKSFLAACEKMEAEQIIAARDVRDEFAGLTLLHEAARLGHQVAVQHLLSIGHSVDPLDSSVSRQTPLLFSILENHLEIASILVRFGANLSIQDGRGENAMHYAARTGARMIKCLIRNSNLSKENIQALVSVTNIKLKFPEDVATTALAKEILISLRERGFYPTYSKTRARGDKQIKR